LFKVKYFMIPVNDYPRAYDTESLMEAIRAMKEFSAKHGKERRSLLVFKKLNDGGEELAGILTMRDIFKILKRSVECSESTEFFTMSWPSFYKKVLLSDCVSINVMEAIRPLVKVSVSPNESLTRATELMMIHNISILPVEEEGRIVGIVRIMDILDNIEDFF